MNFWDILKRKPRQELLLFLPNSDYMDLLLTIPSNHGSWPLRINGHGATLCVPQWELYCPRLGGSV